jgi:hypothetical protein
MLLSTFPNTKSRKNGCRRTCARNAGSYFQVTYTSRQRTIRKACHCVACGTGAATAIAFTATPVP